MTAIIPILYTCIFAFVIWKWKSFQIAGYNRKISISIFLLKIFFGLIFAYIYGYHYTSRITNDSLRFFDDSLALYNLLKESPIDYLKILTGLYTDNGQYAETLHEMNNWYLGYNYELYNNNRTLIRFNALSNVFTFGNIYGNMIFMCFLSYLGLTFTYQWVSQFFIQKKKIVLGAIFLLPSLLFWGSGLLKEGLILFQLGVILKSFYYFFHKKKKLIGLGLFVLASAAIALTKIHILVALLPGIASFVLVRTTGLRFAWLKYLFIHILFFASLFNLKHVNEDMDVIWKLHQKQEGFQNIAELWKSGSAIELTDLEPNAVSFIKNTPEALTHLVVRPHIFEADKPLILFPALENLLILFFLLVCIIFYQKPPPELLNILLFSVSFVLILYTLIGLVTPVMGAFVRYKAPALPFFIIIGICLLDIDKLVRKFPWLCWIKS